MYPREHSDIDRHMRKVHKANPTQVKEMLNKAFALARQQEKERRANLPSFTENLIPHGTAPTLRHLRSGLKRLAQT